MTRRANGDAIRAIREALGIRQDALAARVGITKSQLSKVEHGANGASPEVMRKVADELGVTLDAVTYPVAEPVPQ
jgi:transcriptional regulator with XRE-family HTH domain